MDGTKNSFYIFDANRFRKTTRLIIHDLAIKIVFLP